MAVRKMNGLYEEQLWTCLASSLIDCLTHGFHHASILAFLLQHFPRVEIISATCTQAPLGYKKTPLDVGLAKDRASRCSLHKSSTMRSLKSAGGEMSVFSFTVPTWFMNEQPPGSRDQPTSSANQPTTGCLPVQMCSQRTLCSCRGQRAHAARRCVRKYRERVALESCTSRGSTYYDAQALCWHFLPLLAFAETWKCKLNYGSRICAFSPWGSCASPIPGTTRLLVICRVMGLCVWPGVSAVDWAVESGQTNTIAKGWREWAGAIRRRRGRRRRRTGLCKARETTIGLHLTKRHEGNVINPIDSHYSRRGRQRENRHTSAGCAEASWWFPCSSFFFLYFFPFPLQNFFFEQHQQKAGCRHLMLLCWANQCVLTKGGRAFRKPTVPPGHGQWRSGRDSAERGRGARGLTTRFPLPATYWEGITWSLQRWRAANIVPTTLHRRREQSRKAGITLV